jgi:hypothetical protein
MADELAKAAGGEPEADGDDNGETKVCPAPSSTPMHELYWPVYEKQAATPDEAAQIWHVQDLKRSLKNTYTTRRGWGTPNKMGSTSALGKQLFQWLMALAATVFSTCQKVSMRIRSIIITSARPCSKLPKTHHAYEVESRKLTQAQRCRLRQWIHSNGRGVRPGLAHTCSPPSSTNRWFTSGSRCFLRLGMTSCLRAFAPLSGLLVHKRVLAGC